MFLDYPHNYNSNLKSGLVLVNESSGFKRPEGTWEISLYALTGAKVFNKTLTNSKFLKWSEVIPNIKTEILIYRLKRM